MRNLPLLALFVFCLEVLAVPANAQQSAKIPRVAVLLAAFPVQGPEAQQFAQGLRDLGYTEGRDILIEWRSAEGDYSRLPSLMAETVDSTPDVIVVEGTVAALGVRQANCTVPLVMAVVGEPLASGLVASRARPGGNIMGLSMMASEISIKRLQLFKEAIPALKRVGVLWDTSIAWHEGTLIELTRAAGHLGVHITPVRVKDADGFGSAPFLFS